MTREEIQAQLTALIEQEHDFVDKVEADNRGMTEAEELDRHVRERRIQELQRQLNSR